MTRQFKALLVAAKLPDMRLHDLRHSCATLLLAQGVNPRVVMETLGPLAGVADPEHLQPRPAGAPAGRRGPMNAFWAVPDPVSVSVSVSTGQTASLHSDSDGDFVRKSGEPPRNRTENPQIKSLLLCQLS